MTSNEATTHLKLFQAFGVEIEYMIVDRDNLNVLPIADKVIHSVSGAYPNEVDLGEISWSNELALHVIELKTTNPVGSLNHVSNHFQEHVRGINRILAPFNAQLMPSAMHPWMDPFKEMKLWPHEYNPIYETYDRIFNCKGHGWANLQSIHLNLPFANDEEFAKLHAAIRVILPILPALAASSPIMEKRNTEMLDNRLNVYRHNAANIPSITGKVIPEVSLSRKDYEKNILGKMYRDIAPHDPDNILQYEWLNSHGAIARFDRYAIEVRVLDSQECPQADIAILQAITAVIMALVNEQWATIDAMNSYDLDALHNLLLSTMREGEKAVIDDPHYLNLFGFNNKDATVGELWKYLCRILLNGDNTNKESLEALNVILTEGPLARRILNAWNRQQSDERLHAIYQQLCNCLEQGVLFR
jgi:carboxylate-amine ligase